MKNKTPAMLFEDDICQNRHGGNENSVAAHESARKRKQSDCDRIMQLIDAAGDRGLTCDEACVALGVEQNQISGRFTWLYMPGGPALIEAVGKRPTRRGNMATVYRRRK